MNTSPASLVLTPSVLAEHRHSPLLFILLLKISQILYINHDIFLNISESLFCTSSSLNPPLVGVGIKVAYLTAVFHTMHDSNSSWIVTTAAAQIKRPLHEQGGSYQERSSRNRQREAVAQPSTGFQRPSPNQ